MSSTTYTDSFTYTGDNAYLDALIFGGAWASSQTKVSIKYAIRSGTDPYDINGLDQGNAWGAYEIAALAEAMQVWENVANLDLSRTTDNSEADIWYWKGGIDEVGALGWHEVPTESIVEPIYGVFADDGTGWSTSGLEAGGYGFVTLVHEIGHGLGLAHPHPDGHDSAAFPGVTRAVGSYGDYDLNQGIYTIMGYNDGWPVRYSDHSAQNGDVDYGYSATPMAFDIAAVQEIYGANTSYNTGNNTYVVPDENATGTAWSTIWDAGGEDAISAGGSDRDFRIDLREAPLTGENAGGYVSYSGGIVGGYTIANGAVIENAIGGGGDDTLVGNDEDNQLKGGEGADVLLGGTGDDTILGGSGKDTLNGGADDDIINASGGGADSIIGGGGDDTLSYNGAIGRVFVDLGVDQRDAGFLSFFAEGAASGSTFAALENVIGGGYADNLRGDENDNTLNGGGVSDRLYGRAGDDRLQGGTGADALYGGLGADVMTGGSDEGRRDRYIYFSASESEAGVGNRDVITDFVSSEDRIEITRLDADTTTNSAHDSFDFVGGTEFSGVAGELGYRFESGKTIVQADFDGDEIADFEIQLAGEQLLIETDFLI